MSESPTQAANHKKTALVEVKWAEPFLTIRPSGPQIGQRESPIITDEVTPFLKQAGKTLKVLILDLTDVTFMSSMGLGMCIAFRNQANNVGAKAVLYGASAELLKLLAMMKIEKLYQIARSDDELKAALSA